MYRKSKAGGIKCMHMFTVEVRNPTVVLKQVNHNSTIIREDFMPRKMSRKVSIVPPAEQAQKVKDMEKDLV
eukprot:11416543-Ditylum_brightwellii.AAC.1